MITLLTLATVLITFLVVAGLGIEALRLGGRRAGSTHATRRRAALIWIILFVGTIAMTRGAAAADDEGWQWQAAAIVAVVIFSCLVVGRAFQLRFKRAFLAWLPKMALDLAAGALVLMLTATLGQTFVGGTNSMAPTILANHVMAKCPRCGSPAFGTAEPHDRHGETLMIFSQFHTFQVNEAPSRVEAGDQIVVNRLLEPRRWDVIAFRSPADAETLYIKRMVGLPGEEVVVRDGRVWIDGQPLALPGGIGGVGVLPQAAGVDGIERQPGKSGPIA